MQQSHKIYNFQKKLISPERGAVVADIINRSIIKNHKQMDCLEVGVFKAKLTIALHKYLNKYICSYTGVDPYLGTEKDPYYASYWKKDPNQAEETYCKSKEIYQSLGADLIRRSSNDFFQKNKKKFDLIIIDGDHSYQQALLDLNNGWSFLKEGGLMIADDYGNPDTPYVTTAIKDFMHKNPLTHKKCGYIPLWFINVDKKIPIQQTFVFWKKVK